MKRRESLKLLALCAVRPDRLFGTQEQDTGFASDWHRWPDMRWAGPAHWGNRLQDWAVEHGTLVCRTRAPNRTLHCLTHRPIRSDFSTRVSVDLTPLGDHDPATRVGFRIGAKGPFADYRSAAVRGTGLEAGVTGDGRLFLGDQLNRIRIDIDTPVRIEARAQGAELEITARQTPGSPVISRMGRSSLSGANVAGNLALLSHVEQAQAGPAAAFSDWNIDGQGITVDREATFGPVMFAQYTVHRGILKLTAQLAPVDAIAGTRAGLEMETSAGWKEVAFATADTLSRTARFRVERWDGSAAANYRVRLSIPLTGGATVYTYNGTIAREPAAREPLRAAVFSCNADHGFPDAEVATHVATHNAHLALFLGDQYYEGTGGFGIQVDSVEDAALDMLAKWYMFGWSYREIFRHIPSACIPDDHDVYHGNVWGEDGKLAPTEEGWGALAQDQGGYKMSATWINAVQQTQTSHLPDPFDPTPVKQGIGVYYTRWEYGGISFAILEDRKFKSAPKNVLPPDADVQNGWIHNPAFDIRAHRDLPEAQLLGERQMKFLRAWSEDFSGGAYMKVVLSQTNFAAVHTIPAEAMSGAVLPSLPMPSPGDYVRGDKLSADMDTNGWPQDRRDEVLRVLRTCAAFHIAGDQHLATVVRHGIDQHDDAGYTFTGPALNNIWPRRWWPPESLKLAPLAEDAPPYTGRFLDAFGNRITVHAAANPRATGLEPAILRNRVTGYGIVTFDKSKEQIRMDCWPRHIDPARGDAGQYTGWPITIQRTDGDGRIPEAHLPTVRVNGLLNPVIQVRRADGRFEYAARILGQTYRPPAFAPGPHIIRVGDPDRELWQEKPAAPTEGGEILSFDFDP